jgi:hypothetical protein
MLESLDGSGDLFDLVSTLEYADDVLGGHAVIRAALLALYDKRTPAELPLIADSREVLIDRLREAAPAGYMVVERLLRQPGFEELNKNSMAKKEILQAASDAFSTDTFFQPQTWKQIASQTQKDWVNRALALQQGISLPRLLEQQRQTDASSGPSSNFQVILDESFYRDLSQNDLRFIAPAHRRRLREFCHQLTALERTYPSG